MKAFLFGAIVLAAAGSAFAAQTCRQTAGPQRSQEMVQQCLDVSEATHPPCNASNPCALITDEIKRGCAMLAEPGSTVKAPGYCARYR